MNLVNQSLTETEHDSRLRNAKSPVSDGGLVNLVNLNISFDPNVRRSAEVGNESPTLALFNKKQISVANMRIDN